MTALFENERQETIDNLDLTYAPDGLTLSGHLRARGGKTDAEMLRTLAAKLNAAAAEIEEMEPFNDEGPETVVNPFGKAFD